MGTRRSDFWAKTSPVSSSEERCLISSSYKAEKGALALWILMDSEINSVLNLPASSGFVGESAFLSVTNSSTSGQK